MNAVVIEKSGTARTGRRPGGNRTDNRPEVTTTSRLTHRPNCPAIDGEVVREVDEASVDAWDACALCFPELFANAAAEIAYTDDPAPWRGDGDGVSVARRGDYNGANQYGAYNNSPSEKQEAYIRSLLERSGVDVEAAIEGYKAAGVWTKRAASDLIDALKSAQTSGSTPASSSVKANRYGGRCTKCGSWVDEGAGQINKNDAGKWLVSHLDGECVENEVHPEAKRNVSLEGMHRLDGEIYKVQVAVHGSGNEYAKLLVLQGDGDKGKFEYAPGAIRKLSPQTKMTLEEAKEFGRLYGVCCQCGATLTDENSIAEGIGPVCAGKF